MYHSFFALPHKYYRLGLIHHVQRKKKHFPIKLLVNQGQFKKVASIWILDKFLRRNVYVLFSLRKFEPQELLQMAKPRRRREQSLLLFFRNTSFGLSCFRFSLLQLKEELHSDREQGP
jgi:hypothetical protein